MSQEVQKSLKEKYDKENENEDEDKDKDENKKKWRRSVNRGRVR